MRTYILRSPFLRLRDTRSYYCCSRHSFSSQNTLSRSYWKREHLILLLGKYQRNAINSSLLRSPSVQHRCVLVKRTVQHYIKNSASIPTAATTPAAFLPDPDVDAAVVPVPAATEVVPDAVACVTDR